MTYETFTETLQTLKHAKNYLRGQRGTGDCAASIARNQAINLLNDVEFGIIGEYSRENCMVPRSNL